jgi:hypothetical protein
MDNFLVDKTLGAEDIVQHMVIQILGALLLTFGSGLLLYLVWSSEYPGATFWGWVKCETKFFTGHDPVRLPLGGFRCSGCGWVGATLDEFDLMEGLVTEGWRKRQYEALRRVECPSEGTER